MKEIQLTQGQVVLVDDEDFEYLNQFKWCAKKDHNNYYAMRKETNAECKQMSVYMHRVIMKTVKGIEVDHINHNGLNNQKANLRNCTVLQNQMNKKPKGRSKYLGVSISYNKNGKIRIRSFIQFNKVLINIGSFKTENSAAVAYNAKAVELFGEYANLNRIS